MKLLILPFIASAAFLSFSEKRKEMVYDLRFIENNLCEIPAAASMETKAGETQKTVNMEGFYMFNQEISNGFYLDYLQQLKSQDENAYQKALPDTLVWRAPISLNEPYVEYYLRHPAYRDYPVVGVSYAQCAQFCAWLTKAYNGNPKHKFQQVVFSLPDSLQRVFAARGGVENAPFPWGGPYLRNSKGLYLANFMKVEPEISTAHNPDPRTDITAPVKSYFPNGYGLYNLSGNVEEFMLQEGKTMGGSWRDPGNYLQNTVSQTYDIQQSASSERGFRFVMKIVKQ